MIWIVKSPLASSAGKIFGFRLQLGRSGLRLTNISTIAVFLGAGSWLSTIYLSIPFQESEQEPSAHQFRCEATGASEPAQCAGIRRTTSVGSGSSAYPPRMSSAMSRAAGLQFLHGIN